MNIDKKYYRRGAESAEIKIKAPSLSVLCVSAVKIVFHRCPIGGNVDYRAIRMVVDKLVNSMAETKRRQLIFADFSEVLADIRHLESVGYSRVGKWSLGQMCDHLAKSFDAMIDGYQYMGPWYFRVIARRMLPGILRRKRVPSGAKIPKRFEPPAEISDEIGAWKFTEAIDRFEKFTGKMALHPYFGIMTNEQWRELQLIHCAHHLSFLVPGNREML